MGRDNLGLTVSQVNFVSIHAPAWGATSKRHASATAGGVSIHAPAWGATIFNTIIIKYIRVSIHAPAWGATIAVEIYRHCIPGFNPRARMGRDRGRSGNWCYVLVSIHAPAWGATANCTWTPIPAVFQSTRPHGARPPEIIQVVGRDLFQSTRPHRARHDALPGPPP